MALIGYRFEDKDDIRPFCEKFPESFEALASADAEESKDAVNEQPSSFKWGLDLSRRYKAWVVCGYAEVDDAGNLFNSAFLINHDLGKIHNTRKVLLYSDDTKWCELEEKVSGIENNFQSFTLEFPRLEREVKCGVGICMDINVKDFEQERFQKNEAVLADHQIAQDNQLLIFIGAWCDPTPNPKIPDEKQRQTQTTNYWV